MATEQTLTYEQAMREFISGCNLGIVNGGINISSPPLIAYQLNELLQAVTNIEDPRRHKLVVGGIEKFLNGNFPIFDISRASQKDPKAYNELVNAINQRYTNQTDKMGAF